MEVVTAIFPNRYSAVVARELLGDEHYAFRWLAVTQPADDLDAEGGAAEVHQLAETSDGALGAIGRFLSGAGSSLQKALMDHDVTREDAETVDSSIGVSGAVLVIHSNADRVAEAAKLLEHGGGLIVSITTSGTVPVLGVAPSPGYHAADLDAPSTAIEPQLPSTGPGEREHVFTERR